MLRVGPVLVPVDPGIGLHVPAKIMRLQKMNECPQPFRFIHNIALHSPNNTNFTVFNEIGNYIKKQLA